MKKFYIIISFCIILFLLIISLLFTIKIKPRHSGWLINYNNEQFLLFNQDIKNGNYEISINKNIYNTNIKKMGSNNNMFFYMSNFVFDEIKESSTTNILIFFKKTNLINFILKG